jgi:4-hydroxy-tetrahydrodipicolinate synthase
MHYAVKDAKRWVRETLKGYFVCTTMPFKADLAFDEEGLRHNVRHLLNLKSTSGLYVNSVFQEYTTLTVDERMRSSEVVTSEVAGRVPVIVEVTAESHLDAIRLANHAREFGADLVMLGVPHVGLRTREGVLDYFRIIARETDIGISIFSTSWADVGFQVTADMLIELAEIDAVCMVKDATADILSFYETLASVGPRMVVSRPSEQFWLAGRLVMGAELCPPLWMGTMRPVYCDDFSSRFEEAVTAEDWATATEAMRRVAGLGSAMAKNHKRGHHDVAFIKAVSSFFGMAAGPVRPPLSYPGEAELQEARRVLELAGTLPAPASKEPALSAR